MHGERCSVAETQFLSTLQSSDKPHAVPLVLLGKLPARSYPPRRSQYKFKAHVSRALKKPVQLYLSIFQIYLTAEPFSTLTLYNSARSFVR